LKIRCKANAEIVAEIIKLFNITAATQDANTTAAQNANTTAKKIASKATKICIIYMHYLSIVETNINFRRQQTS